MRLKIPLLSVGLAMACLGPPTDLAAQIISGGGKHCLSVCSDSTVQAWGYNLYGQLGNDDNDDSNVPVSVGSLTGVIAVEGGGIGHSLALKSDSTVWAWGLNLFGQLGDGSTTSRDVPVLVDQLNGIVSITGGGGAHHSLALRADGTVWSWGYNEFGQLGNGTNVDSHIPVPVGSLSDVKAVSAGAFHSLALKDDGTVWAWGYNAQGQLGNGLEGFENNSILPVPVSILTDVIAIEGGQLQSIALTNDGFVWAWGNNFYGQLGNGTNTNSNVPVLIGSIENITAIAAGRSCFFALKSDGTVWAWGNNIYGTLGDGTTVDRNVPVQVAGLPNIIAISGGWTHSLALDDNGTIWTWGQNEHGGLGNGTNNDSSLPVQVVGACAPLLISVGEATDTSSLLSVHPNPADQSATVSISLAHSQAVSVSLLDAQNKWVRTIVKGKVAGGAHEYVISLAGIPEGVYYCRVRTEDGSLGKKLLVIRQ